jgi:hypothetical protein
MRHDALKSKRGEVVQTQATRNRKEQELKFRAE